MEFNNVDTLIKTKRSVIEGYGGNFRLLATITGDEVDGERVSGHQPAVVRLVGERDGVAGRGGRISRPHLVIDW